MTKARLNLKKAEETYERKMCAIDATLESYCQVFEEMKSLAHKLEEVLIYCLKISCFLIVFQLYAIDLSNRAKGPNKNNIAREEKNHRRVKLSLKAFVIIIINLSKVNYIKTILFGSPAQSFFLFFVLQRLLFLLLLFLFWYIVYRALLSLLFVSHCQSFGQT